MRNLDIVSCQEPFRWITPEVEGLRVAMLGAGKMARLHFQTLKAMPGVSLVGICSRTAESGKQLADEFGIERTYQDARRMFEETMPDAVFVAVSHSATFEISSLVLKSGIPCLLEKPAGYSSEQTRYLSELAQTYGNLNLVGLNRRFYSVINQALLAVLQQGPIRGVLVEAHEPILEYRSRRQFESWLYDRWMIANTIHAIDLLRMIGGEVIEIQAFGHSKYEPRGDGFSASMEFADGALGTFIAHWNSARGFYLKIYGEGVVAELGPLEQGYVRYDTGRRIKLKPDWADIQFKPGLYAQNATFLQSVYDHVAPPFPASDLSDNVNTMQLIERIEENILNPIGHLTSNDRTLASVY